MGFFSSITDFIAPILGPVGSFFGGPIGGAIGSALGAAVGPAISGGASFLGAQATNTNNLEIAREGNIFNEAAQQRAIESTEGQSARAIASSEGQAERANLLTSELAGKATASTEGMSARAIAATEGMQQNALDQAQRQFLSSQNYAERLSGTAYQRAIKDMKASGLNPILAYQKGGASSPVSSPGPTVGGAGTGGSGTGGSGSTGGAASGGAASASAVTIPRINAVQAGLQTARQMVQLQIQGAQAKEQLELTRTEKRRNINLAGLTKQQTRTEEQRTKREELMYHSDRDVGVSTTGKNVESLTRMIKKLWGILGSSGTARSQ